MLSQEPSDPYEKFICIHLNASIYGTENLSVAKMILWAPEHGNKRPGRLALTYIDTIKKDTGWDSDIIKIEMHDCGVWKAIVVQDMTRLK